jgi:hypothetical protein
MHDIFWIGNKLIIAQIQSKKIKKVVCDLMQKAHKCNTFMHALIKTMPKYQPKFFHWDVKEKMVTQKQIKATSLYRLISPEVDFIKQLRPYP